MEKIALHSVSADRRPQVKGDGRYARCSHLAADIPTQTLGSYPECLHLHFLPVSVMTFWLYSQGLLFPMDLRKLVVSRGFLCTRFYQLFCEERVCLGLLIMF